MKLPAKTVKATHECIDRWFDIIEGKAPPSCQLCKRFPDMCKDESTGEVCPIVVKTGAPCVSSKGAYTKWIVTRHDRDKGEAAARSMIDLLISLLPEGQRHHYY